MKRAGSWPSPAPRARRPDGEPESSGERGGPETRETSETIAP
jgi:hypothetical protein